MTARFFHGEKEHVYKLDGVLLPSITDTLADQGFVDYGFLPAVDRPFYLKRGTAVAEATRLFDLGVLDWKSLRETVDWNGRQEPWTLGPIRAYCLFRALFSKWKPVAIEKPLPDPVYGYAGRPDRLFETPEGFVVVQIKKGKVERWVGLQTAAEARLFEENDLTGGGRVKKRYGLELRTDGTFKASRDLTPFKDPNDIKIFLSALAVLKWKRMNGGRAAKLDSGTETISIAK